MAEPTPFASPAQRIKADLARERELGREEGRLEIEPLAARAVAVAIPPLKAAHEAHIKREDSHNTLHVKRAWWGALWLGVSIGSILTAVMICALAWGFWRDQILTMAAAESIQNRAAVNAQLSTHEPGALPGGQDCQRNVITHRCMQEPANAP